MIAARDKAGKGENHGKHLTSSSVKEKPSATDALNDEPRRGSEDAVDDHVDTAQKHGKTLVSKDLITEDGEVVDDGVAAANLLHELGTGAEHHTPEVLGLSTSEKGLYRSRLLANESRCADRVKDRVSLLAGVVAVDLITTNGGDDTLGVLVSLVSKEPSGTLGEPDHGNAEDEAKDALEGNGETPGEVLVSIGSTIVDPVGDEGTESNDTTLNADEKTTVAGLTALGLVRRNSRGVDAVADSSDDTADDELSKLGVALDGRDLDNNTDYHDNTSHNHGASSAEKITNPEDEHGAHQAANLVDGSDQPLDRLVLGFREIRVKGVSIYHSRHNPLVVAEKEETSRGHRRDGQRQFLAREAGECRRRHIGYGGKRAQAKPAACNKINKAHPGAIKTCVYVAVVVCRSTDRGTCHFISPTWLEPEKSLKEKTLNHELHDGPQQTTVSTSQDDHPRRTEMLLHTHVKGCDERRAPQTEQPLDGSEKMNPF